MSGWWVLYHPFNSTWAYTAHFSCRPALSSIALLVGTIHRHGMPTDTICQVEFGEHHRRSGVAYTPELSQSPGTVSAWRPISSYADYWLPLSAVWFLSDNSDLETDRRSYCTHISTLDYFLFVVCFSSPSGRTYVIPGKAVKGRSGCL